MILNLSTWLAKNLQCMHSFFYCLEIPDHQDWYPATAGRFCFGFYLWKLRKSFFFLRNDTGVHFSASLKRVMVRISLWVVVVGQKKKEKSCPRWDLASSKFCSASTVTWSYHSLALALSHWKIDKLLVAYPPAPAILAHHSLVILIAMVFMITVLQLY